MLKVAKPPPQQRVEVRDDAREAVPAGTPRLGPDTVLKAGQAGLSYVPPPGFEAVAEKVKPYSRLPAIADVGLLRMQAQAVLGHPPPDHLQRRVRLGLGAAQHDEVVGIARHPIVLPGQPCIQRGQVDVGQQRAN
jgi:hypothetical protein